MEIWGRGKVRKEAKVGNEKLQRRCALSSWVLPPNPTPAQKHKHTHKAAWGMETLNE